MLAYDLCASALSTTIGVQKIIGGFAHMKIIQDSSARKRESAC